MWLAGAPLQPNPTRTSTVHASLVVPQVLHAGSQGSTLQQLYDALTNLCRQATQASLPIHVARYTVMAPLPPVCFRSGTLRAVLPALLSTDHTRHGATASSPWYPLHGNEQSDHDACVHKAAAMAQRQQGACSGRWGLPAAPIVHLCRESAGWILGRCVLPVSLTGPGWTAASGDHAVTGMSLLLCSTLACVALCVALTPRTA